MKLKYYFTIIFLTLKSSILAMSLADQLAQTRFLTALANNNSTDLEKIKKDLKDKKKLNEYLIFYIQANTNIGKISQELDKTDSPTGIQQMALFFLKNLKVDQEIYRAAELKFTKNTAIKPQIKTKFIDYMKSLFEKAVKFLIESGADKNFKDQNGNSTLMLAGLDDNIAMVDYLLTFPGINIDNKNKDGKTALELTTNNEIKKLIENKVYQEKTEKKPTLSDSEMAKLFSNLNFRLYQLQNTLK